MAGDSREDERELEGAAELLCRSLDDAPTGLIVSSFDAKCVAINRRFVSWIGPSATPEDAQGASLLMSGNEPLVEAIERAGDGEVSELDTDQLPFAPDRRGWWRVHVLPLRVDDRIVGASIAFEDLTEQAHVVRAFEASERRFKVLVDAATDGIAAHRDGILLYMNPAGARMFGYESADDIVGRSILDFVHSDDHERVNARIAELVRTGQAPLTEEVFVRKDGTPLPVEVAASRAPLDERAANFVFFRDITERKRMQAELERARRMESLGRLAGGIAHDFNNLLTGIRASLQMARRADGDRGAIHEALDRAEAAALRASDVIRQLLTFSRGSEAEAANVDPNPVVREAVDLVSTMSQRGMQIEMALDPDAGSIWMAPSQLHQVVLNLLINAHDSIEGTGRIRVQTGSRSISKQAATKPERAGRWVVVTVSDTGSGMDAATRGRIFEPFFTTKPPGEGTGLGLSTVYGVVKQADGWIDVVSEPGHGTLVRVFLPLADEAEPRRVATPAEQPRAVGCSTSPAPEPQTILICDDERRLAMLTAGLLEPLGYRTVTAYRATDALELLTSATPPVHLLVLDVHLRPTPASEFLAEMDARSILVPVILSSGYAREDIPDELMSHPLVVGYLAKPYPVEELAELVSNALDHAAPPRRHRDPPPRRDLH